MSSSSYSWVTLATNDSYSLGALVLAHSLKQVGTKQHLSVLITPGVTNAMRSKLSEVFNVVQEVNVLDSKDEANLRLLKRPELGVTFTKLHCWRLTQFDKCVFLDADTLVLENCDELFEREELSAAPDIGWPDCFNSGVFVYRPSNETYEKLIEFALEKGSFDGGDQGLLNLYFFDWAHKDISKHLPFIYNMASTACYSYLPAFKQFGAMAKIIHFIGSSKPWLQYFDTETKQVHPSQGYDHLKMILQHWWDIFCSMIHPCLSPDMTPSHTDTAHGSPYSYPSDNIYSSNFHDDPYYKQIDTSQSIFNHAELCQNVWDPWEEYDSRQFQNEPVLVETCYHTTENNPYHQENHIHLNNHHETYHSNTDLHDSEVQNYSNQTYQEPQIYNPPQTNQHPDQIVSTDNQSSFIRDTHNFSVDNLHHCYSSEFQAPESSSSHPDSCQPPAQSHNQSRSHFIQVNNHISQHEQKLLESHNTNACTDADHCHYSHPQIPSQTYSYPQSQPVAHIESSTTSPQEAFTMSQTPSFNEHELSECVTATVSSDISKGDKENDAGIAGAFAKLTLGQPRTAEQLALDDHLRRQGWEVGKIDYLGRDSFDNIWNKICETLSSAPTLPEQKTKDPSSSSSEVKELEQSLTEVKTDIEESSESISPTQVISLSTTDLGITSEALSKQTPNLPPTEHSPLLPPPDLSKSSTQSQPALEHPETMSDTKQPSQQVAAESKLVAESEQIVKGGFKPNFEPSIAVSESSKPVSELQKTIVEPPTPVTEPATPDTELPKAVTELPTPVTKPPTPVTKPPTPVTEPLTPVTEPLTPSTEPTKPVAESQKPVTEPPKPVTEPPKPVAELPKTVAEPPKPVAEPPQPVAEPPNPVAEPPKPVAEPPKPVAKPPKPVAEPPKPIAEPPKPVAEPPKPFVESPKPVVESPKPVAESPKPVVEYPRTVAEPPKTVAELPETVAEPPQSPTGISPPVAESPKPVTEGSKLALETPKSGTEPTNTTAESPKIISEPQKSLTESLKPRTEPSKSTAKSVGEQSKPVGEQSKPFQAEKSVSEGCSVKSKQTSSGESKDSRKSKGIPKTQVTETTPPTSPVWPQTKQALNVDTSIPDTPPPAAQESATAGPTPPPRKGSSGTKKTASKTKK